MGSCGESSSCPIHNLSEQNQNFSVASWSLTHLPELKVLAFQVTSEHLDGSGFELRQIYAVWLYGTDKDIISVHMKHKERSLPVRGFWVYSLFLTARVDSFPALQFMNDACSILKQTVGISEKYKILPQSPLYKLLKHLIKTFLFPSKNRVAVKKIFSISKVFPKSQPRKSREAQSCPPNSRQRIWGLFGCWEGRSRLWPDCGETHHQLKSCCSRVKTGPEAFVYERGDFADYLL